MIHNIKFDNFDDYNSEKIITRIIVISDGDDSNSYETDTHLIIYLIKEKITLDTIFVSEKKIDKNFFVCFFKNYRWCLFSINKVKR